MIECTILVPECLSLVSTQVMFTSLYMLLLLLLNYSNTSVVHLQFTADICSLLHVKVTVDK